MTAAINTKSFLERAISSAVATALLRHAFDKTPYTPPSTLWCGLHSVKDSMTPGLTISKWFPEPAQTTGYHRVPVTFAKTAARTVANSGNITFPTAVLSWGNIAGFALYDAPIAGNWVCRGLFNGNLASIPVPAGKTCHFPSGILEFTWDFASYVESAWYGISDYLADKLNGLLFLGQTFACPDVFVGISETEMDGADTVATITECSAEDYFRWQINPSTGASPKWMNADYRVGFPSLMPNAIDTFDPGELITEPPDVENWGWLRGFYVDTETPGTGNLLAFCNRLSYWNQAGDVISSQLFYSKNNKVIHLDPQYVSVGFM